MKRLLVLLICSIFGWGMVQSQTIRMVTNLNDAGTGSLRQMISSSSSGDYVTFDNSLAGGTIVLTTGQITINTSISILGLGHSQLTISGNNSSRIFNIVGGNVSIRDLKLINGFQNQSLDNNGGAILYNVSNGQFNLSNVHILNSSAINRNGSQGGGIAFYGTNGIFRADSCVIKNCQSDGYGSAVVINASPALGTLNYCLIDSNQTGSQGVVFSNSRKMIIRNTTLVNNRSTGNMSLISWNGNTNTDTISCINSTFSNNIADYPYAAFMVSGGVTSLLNCTFKNNNEPILYQGMMTTPKLIIKNTIFDNLGPDFQNNFYSVPDIISGGGNICSDNSFRSYLRDIRDQHEISPLLDVLAQNGAITPTHALLAGSPAIGTAVDTGAPAIDQRGIPRTLPYDIGAFETNSVPLSVSISSNSPVCSGLTITLTASETNGATYFWTGPNGFTANTRLVSLSNFNNSMVGVYTVVMTVNSVSVQDTLDARVINSQSIFVGSNSPVCEGNTLNLSSTFIQGASYLWTGPLGYSSDFSSPSILNTSPSQSGTYSLSVDQGICGVSTYTVSVLIAPVVTVSIYGNNLCTLDSMVLTATAIQNAQYVWFAPDGYTYHGHPLVRYNVSPQMLGVYTVTVNATQCSNGNYTGLVQLNTPSPVTVSSNSPVCAGGTLNLSSTFINNATYQWTGPQGFTSNVSAPVLNNFQPNQAGVYSLWVTQNSCPPVLYTTTVQTDAGFLVPNWTVGTGGDFPDLATALASPNVINGNVLRVLPGTYSVTSTLTISKSVTIVGNPSSPGQVVFETPNTSGAPTTMFSVNTNDVRMMGLTIRHRKTTNSSVETAISVSGGGFPQTRVSGFVMSDCRVEHVEFGLSIRGENWLVQNSTISYGNFGQPNNSTRRHIGLYGVSGNCFVNNIIFEDNTNATTGNSRAITPTSTTGTNPNETYAGNLVVQNCTQIGRLQQFYSQDAFQGTSGSLNLWFNNNTTSETSLFVGFYGVTTGFGDILGSLHLTGNSFSNVHSTSPIGGKGMIGVDGSGNFRSGDLMVYETGNTPSQSSFRSDYVSTVVSGSSWVCGRITTVQSFNTTLLGSGFTAPVLPLVPSLLVTSSNSPMCQGPALNLSASTITGATYSWSGPMGFLSAAQNPVLSPSVPGMSGVYSLTLSTSCGNSQHLVTVNIYAHPDSAIVGSNSPVCTNGGIQLNATNHPEYSYLWTGPSGFTSSSPAPVISSAQTIHSGIYTVQISTSNCGSVIKYAQVQVLESPSLTAGSNSPVCENATVQLSASSPGSGNQYFWIGPNGFSSNVANPMMTLAQSNQSGAYSVFVSNACGNSTATVIVSVISGSGTIQASSNSPVCTGGTLQLSVDGPAGLYQWSGPSGFTATGVSPSISSLVSNNGGIYSVTLVQGGCGHPESTVQVVVNPGVTASASSNSPVCAGSPIYLNATPVSGAGFTWTGPGGFSVQTQNASVPNSTPAQSGVYTLTVVTPNCGTATTAVPVSVGGNLSGANAGSNSPICSGGQLNLTISNVSNGTYSWVGPDGFTSDQQVVSRNAVQPSQGGIYTAVITSPGCGTTTRTINVIVNNSTGPVTGSNSPVCQGNVIYLSTTPITGATYSWTGPNNFSSSTQFPSVSNAQSIHAGVYTLQTNVPGCGVTTNTVSVTVNAPITGLSVTSNSPVCSSNTLQFSSNNQSGFVYNWTGPNGFTSTSASPFIQSAVSGNSGIYTVVVSSAGCGSTSRTVSATVVQSPVVSAGSNSPLCQNAAISLTSSTVAGATYLWSGPNGFTSALQNPTILTAQSIHGGLYSVTVTVSGCTPAQSQASVTVSQVTTGGTLLSNSPLCTGQTLQLSVNGLASGVTYSWTGPNGFTSSQNNPVLAGFDQVNAGVYSLNVSSLGCSSTNYTISVSHLPVLNATASVNSPACAGSSVTLNGQTVSGVTYLWEGPGGYSSSQSTPVLSNVQPTQSGVYTFTMSRSGCGSSSTTVSLQVGAGYGSVMVQSNSPLCSGATLSVTASDAPGTTTLWTAPDGFTTGSAQFTRSNMSALEAGIYTYSISSPGCGTTVRTLTVSVNTLPTLIAGSNSPVCQGNVVYLAANAVAGAVYSWTGPNGFISSAQNPSVSSAQPVSSGIYSVTATVAGCGSVSSTTSVTVGASPSAVTATSNSPVCSGLNLNLSGTVINGLSYSWAGPGGFTSNVAQPSISGVSGSNAGVYTLIASSVGCASVTRTHTVIVSGLTITPGSNSPICQGAALMLTTNSVSGATYSWAGPNGYVSASQSPSISNAQPNRTGIYTLTVTSGSCGVTSTTTSVTVGSTIGSLSLTSNSPVCSGNNLSLSITDRIGFSFVWTGPNGFTSNLATPVITGVTGAAAGRYTVVVVSAGCGSTTVQSSNLVVNNGASVTAGSTSPVCIGAPIYFTGSAPAGSTFSWSGPSGYASSLQNPSRSNAQLSHAGVYTMTANVVGCGAVTTTTTVVVNPCRNANDQAAGVREFMDNADWTMDVYPNPTDGMTKVSVKGLSNENPVMKVLDVMGHEVLIPGKQSREGGVGYWDLDFSQFPGGVYFIRLEDSGRIGMERLIVR